MSENKKPKLVIGFILFKENTARYLPYFLPSLKEQDFSNFKTIAFINKYETGDENEIFLKKYYPKIEIIKAEENTGFAHANNRMIKKALGIRADYFLTINPDMILEKDVVSKMIEALENDGNLASVSPKILKWNFFKNKKTNIIDTCGIKMLTGLRFYDLGQGMKDDSNIYKERIIGPSGACAMYRMRDLEKIKEKEQYFDENMFMYKEDCDISYKLFLIGSGSKLVDEAIVYHDRTASCMGNNDMKVAQNRKNKSKQVKIWSFQGQQIIFIKYWHLQNLWAKLSILFYEIRVIGYCFIFERYLLKEFLVLWKKRGDIHVYK